LNIIFISRFYPPDTGGGGIAAYIRYAALSLTNAGHKVRVVSAMGQDSKPEQIVDGVEVFRIQPWFVSYFWRRLPLIGRQMRLIQDVFYALQVRNTLLRISHFNRPDIVEYADIDAEGIFHPKYLCLQVIKLHTPHVILRKYYTKKQVPYAQTGIEWLEAMTIHRAAGISSPSQNLAREIESAMQISPERIQYIPNFIDTDAWSAGKVEEQPLSVLYVGRLDGIKGASVFAEAIPTIALAFPQAKFIFLGADRADKQGGSQKETLLRSLEQNGLQEKVHFYGHNSPEVFLSFYRQAAVFVLPSFFENCPFTLLEAMSCAKACVVSRSGGMPEMLTDGESGLFFTPGNAEELAQKVIDLLQDEQKRRQLGLAARQRAEQEYSLQVGGQKTLAFYKSVLEQEKT